MKIDTVKTLLVGLVIVVLIGFGVKKYCQSHQQAYNRGFEAGYQAGKTTYYPDGVNFSWEEIEKIGNKYENPELIEEKND